jgi:hypothetical protein
MTVFLRDYGRAARRREEHRLRKAQRSEYLTEMVQEELGAPKEVPSRFPPLLPALSPRLEMF